MRPSSALDPTKSLGQYAHRIWAQEEGLFQPTVYSIAQTRDGFLWLGTQDSLIRFDGMRFREFGDGESTVFHHSLIKALLEDRDGNLWVGSIGAGVAEISPGGALTRFATKEGLPSDSVFCLDSGHEGDMWACTNLGLAQIAGSHIHVFTTADGLPSNQVRSTCTSSDGTRWVAGIDYGLSRFNGKRFLQYSDKLISPSESVTALACGNDGSVWAGIAGGLVRITEGSSHLFTQRDGLPDNEVLSLSEGPDGSIWIGADDGLARYSHGNFSAYRTRDGLSHSMVLSLYLDREGTLWAGTKNGLDQFTDGKVTPYTTNEGLLSNETGPVLEDAAGRLWIGTLGHGLDAFDGEHFHAITRRDGLNSDTILSLEAAKGGDLWVGTSRGLNRLSRGQVVASYSVRDGLSGPEVRALFFDMQGTLWAGTNEGLDRFDGVRFVRADGRRAVSGSGVVALAGGRTTRLFVSTDAPGFYSLRDSAFQSHALDAVHAVDCYYLDHVRHIAWMGTLGSGLLRWQNGVITHLHVKDGLYDNRIYSILRDDNANFWMASSKGIFRVSEKDLDDFSAGKTHFVTSIPFSTGQLRFECQSGVQPAGYRTHDGRLWFSTNNGLVMVDPNHLGSNQSAPPVQITAAFINGRHFDAQTGLRVNPWDEKNLEIRYAGLTFVSPEKVTFRYMLEGYDKKWVDAGARREAFFTNLPPGHFNFKVMARNADGLWSAQPASLAFTVEPRLYQHIWFFPALALLIGVGVAAGYRVRIRQLNHRFELVLAERSRIARELHDTLLQGLSGITMQLQALWTRLPIGKEKHFLGEIITDAGKCSQEARQSLWGLRTRAEKPLPFSERLVKLVKQTVNGRSIALSLEIEPVSTHEKPEFEYQLLRIAQEVISNTLSHSGATALRVQLEIQDSQISLTVTDNGSGFLPETGQRFGHFGLIGIRERADEIDAELTVASDLGRGTSVRIRAPLSAGVESNPEAPAQHQFS